MTDTDVIIRIKKNTREKLLDMGSKRETYDDIINRLIKNGKETV